MKLNEDNFLKVLKENQGIILKIVNSYCKKIEDRDDLIQEITIQLWKSWKNYNSDYKISTWMYRIALNVAITFYRKTSRKETLIQPLKEELVFVHNNEDIDLSESVKQLYYFISKFNALNKALILLYLDQYSYEEIASVLGISKTNVSTKISRIKMHLKKEFNLKK
ncbi:sigma-70 family RNA polymerase sigma factor [Aquimarina sp. 2201CG5-10]|uniref:RNA polymerase sigma factor n=1 Tax=Aquimarina callyspongiae TaxID=3098150 RepID=UPI002AB4D35A|nr:sigma-70 family RNA polymerase sigma factor [Aquimarina sp. 2201CG5-10]MDY8134309.1 sigma-70 family RNA polymerase sigma factor [Aquimarina sp. 2201CG5-10]